MTGSSNTASFRARFAFLGFGAGLRRQHYSHVLERHPPIDWFEVVSENFMGEGGRPLEVLSAVRERYPIALHGVSMSLGSTDPLNRDYLRKLRGLARRFNPAWISDHLCWTGVGGHNLHDLLPLPYTEEALRHAAGRIREVQETLEQPILIENVSNYMTFVDSTMTEWDFISGVAEEADCGILLDINNIYVSAFNHRFDPNRYVDSVPPERVVQYHLAGHSDHGTYLLDSHDHPVRDEVWRLYERAVRRFGAVSAIVEWDDHIPEFSELAETADQARRIFLNAAPPPENRNGDATKGTGTAPLPADRRA
ncbi:MAG: MNIO family bufferin maturase [Candidatus Binataceae bacterium]